MNIERIIIKSENRKKERTEEEEEEEEEEAIGKISLEHVNKNIEIFNAP